MRTKRIFEYRDERDRDLIGAYRRQLDRTPYPIVLHEVVQEMVESSSSRFWVSPERASHVISEMTKGCDLHGMTRNKQRMFQEIYRRVQTLRRMPDYQQISLSTLVQIVVEQPAPSFYMTPQSAIVIMHRIRKRRRKCNRSE